MGEREMREMLAESLHKLEAAAEEALRVAQRAGVQSGDLHKILHSIYTAVEVDR